MERLSTLDAEFVHFEDEVTHMHIAGISIFDGPAPTEEELVALLASKIHLIPRYRQRVRAVPLELGRPVWTDDPHFNLAYHIRHTALPPPGDDAMLTRLMGRLMSQPLDRERPLWEMWLVEGLPDGRWAIISKVHHCMVDGISGVDLLSVVLDASPHTELPPPRPWTPTSEPSPVAKVLDAWRGLASDLIDMTRGLPTALRDPAGAVRSLATTGEGLLRFGRSVTSTPPLSIEGTIGPHRVWAHSSASIDEVRLVRKQHGGTLNDVVLCAVARGYRDLLISRREDPDAAVLRTLVPVSLRTEDARGVLDNRVSAMIYELPVHVADPVERLESVRAQMSALKESHMVEAGGVATTLADLAPPMIIGTTSRLAMRLLRDHPQRSINTVVTNVPGPQFPLYCLGREMVDYLPFVPIAPGVRVGTAILSYNGRLAFGVTGDFDTVPDVDLVARGIRAGMDELVTRSA